MTAYEAMSEILDINETTERLKNSNMGTTCNGLIAQEVELLTRYRVLLVEVMKNTDLSVSKNN